MIVVGEGREKFGHAFMMDTGSSCGEIVGHSKIANGVSIRTNRPFRAVTCSDDMTVNFYHGVPYKFQFSLTDHSRFVTTAKFNPSGNQFASTGLDGKIFLYDGSTGAKLKEILDPDQNGHKGGILGLSWSPNSKQFITSSADTTVKLWDVETNKVVTYVCKGIHC
jgi:WD40 repeat protein